MRSLKSIFILSLISFSSFAQENDFKRFAAGVHFSTDYSHRRLSLADKSYGNGFNGYLLTERNNQENPFIGFEAGAKILFYVKPQFAIEAGISYSKKGYMINAVYNNYPDPVQHILAKWNYNYLEVPVKADAILGQKKVRFIASAGLTPAFLISQEFIMKNGYTSTNTEDYNRFNLFVTAAAGIEFGLGEKTGIQLQPNYRYGLFKMYNEGSIAEHLWQAGLNLGLTYKF